MSKNPLFPDASILVLAGGQGSRMGGQDKGWVDWRGKPMIEHIWQVLRPLTNDLIISCNRNQARYARLADQIVSDTEQNFAGPMAGISAALQVARGKLLLVVPCDAPAITVDLLAPLYQAGLTQLSCLQRGQQLEPLFAAIPRSVQAQVQALWQQGQHSPRKNWLALQARVISCAGDDPRLVNFNDLLALENT